MAWVPLTRPSPFFFSSHPVIGRGGEQINKIQQDSGCKVQISPGMALHLRLPETGAEPAPWAGASCTCAQHCPNNRSHSAWRPPLLYVCVVFILSCGGRTCHSTVEVRGQLCSAALRVTGPVCLCCYLAPSIGGIQRLTSGHQSWR